MVLTSKYAITFFNSFICIPYVIIRCGIAGLWLLWNWDTIRNMTKVDGVDVYIYIRLGLYYDPVNHNPSGFYSSILNSRGCWLPHNDITIFAMKTTDLSLANSNFTT